MRFNVFGELVEIKEPQAACGAPGAQSLEGSSLLGLGTEDIAAAS